MTEKMRILLVMMVLILGVMILVIFAPEKDNYVPKPTEIHFLDTNGEFYAASIVAQGTEGCYDIIGVNSPYFYNCSVKQSISGIYCGPLTIIAYNPNDVCTQ